MNEKGHKTAMNLAGISEFVGLIFCVLGVVSGYITLTGGMLGGALVLAGVHEGS